MMYIHRIYLASVRLARYKKMAFDISPSSSITAVVIEAAAHYCFVTLLVPLTFAVSGKVNRKENSFGSSCYTDLS